METYQFVLASRPIGLPSAGNFRIEKAIPGELQDNEVILKSWYISVDPYMRGRMNSAKSYIGYSILPHLLTRSVMLQGFIVSNYSSKFPEVISHLSEWLNEGKLIHLIWNTS